ncbi:hypothetical protein DF3PA_310016 [Candidatus Defluviicoccus seviourii]|uniref:CRISPR type III-associated protein domain-containing protein n=2 Tax=root TaxID=1 RepID=A0A564WEU7_9PROT|nr:hypothetical protein DF3PB_150017 [uncultured Defluviicoccus sp.]VUX47002.1 hypothetical protein DF3PA_310016 [Candidatus Defluviicoccus seviourii]
MASETFTLELVSPAFLAGADQSSAESCELRVPSLRGQLRWWWRTLHAAHVDVPTLRRLEAAVWGSTDAASPVRLSLKPVKPPKVSLFDHKEKSRPKPQFEKAHNLVRPPNNKTTQGLFYLAYGMDENIKEHGKTIRKQRYYLEPGGRWDLGMICREGRFPVDAKNGKPIATELIERQARAAVSLLCRYGGVGSKARKGFGSFGEFKGNIDEEACRKGAYDLRKACLPEGYKAPVKFETPSRDHALPPIEIPLGTTDPWNALDRLGFAVQGYAQHYAHKERKEALGLPRRIHGPHSSAATWLGSSHPYLGKTAPKDFRHAAPVHYHLGKGNNGTLLVRVIAFPSSVLPDAGTSDTVLKGLLAHIEANLGPSTTAPAVGAPSAGAGKQPPAGAPALRFRKGQRVRVGEEEATVLDPRPGRNGMIYVNFEYGSEEVDPKDCTLLD